MINVINESKKRIDLPVDIAEFVFSRQPDMDGDDYEFERAIDECELFADLSDEAYEDQDALESDLSKVSDQDLIAIASKLGVYRCITDDDLAYYADKVGSSDDLMMIMKMNGFKNVERVKDKIYYSVGRSSSREYITAPEWR